MCIHTHIYIHIHPIGPVDLENCNTLPDKLKFDSVNLSSLLLYMVYIIFYVTIISLLNTFLK